MKVHYESRQVVPKGVQEFSWQNAAKKLVAAVPTGVLLDTDEWQLPDITVKVRARRTVNATVGEYQVKLKTGDTATVPVGVFEVLCTSGALEMA